MSKLILFATLALLSINVFGQQQSHTDAAKQLLDLMNADQSIEQAYGQMYSQLSGMAEQLGITEDQRPMFESYLERMVVVMKEELSWERIEPFVIDAYVSVYSEEELKELSEFYASPIGQKFVAKMPELMQATMEMSQKMMGELIPRITEIQQELMAEARKGQSDRQ
jgi:hypothetical protein